MSEVVKKLGACSALPSEKDRRFRISLCFASQSGQESPDNWTTKTDPQLGDLIRKAVSDLQDQNFLIFVGDPEHALELALPQLEAQLGRLSGFLVITRQAKLGPDDELPKTKEEWDEKAGPISWTPALMALFDHIRRYYQLVKQ